MVAALAGVAFLLGGVAQMMAGHLYGNEIFAAFAVRADGAVTVIHASAADAALPLHSRVPPGMQGCWS